jgi:surface protein
MSNFLDKVGLQHFVDKIKGLLSGYLPLSGGDISGGLQQTMHEGGAEISTTLYKGFDYYYSTLTPDNTNIGTTCAIRIDIDGIVFNKNVSTTNDDNINTQAYFDTEKCNTKKFVLSGDPNQGLIANDSETVVKELSAADVLEILRKDSASSITSKHYLSETGLSAVSQAMYNKISETIIQTNADTVIYPGYISHINIPAYTNFCINTASWSIDNSECITFMLCKGFVDTTNFLGLRDIHTFDARYSKLLNKSLDSLFEDCEHLNIVEISDWNIDIVTSCSSMFKGCTAITSIFLDMWDTRNITDTSYMFYNCSRIDTISLAGWNTQSVKTMVNMFTACSQLTDLTLGPGFGRMKDSVGTLDLSALTKWTNYSVQTLLDLYDRKANGMGVITIKLSAATKNALGTSGIQTLTAKGYTIA